jgi:hypothetical protein
MRPVFDHEEDNDENISAPSPLTSKKIMVVDDENFNIIAI